MLTILEQVLMKHWENGLILNEVTITIIFVLFIVWLIKKISISPKGTVEFFDYLINRRIENINNVLTYSALSSSDKSVLEVEQKALILKKWTGIANRRVLLPLWKILSLEQSNIPISYFKLSSGFIKKNYDGDLILEINWTFWIFEWFIIRLLSFTLLVHTGYILLLVFFANKDVSSLAIFIALMLACVCVFVSLSIWLSSLRRGQIRDTRVLLSKYIKASNNSM